MEIIHIIEILSLVSGIAFMILQVLQNRFMWYLDIVTASCALVVAFSQHLWAASALNLYYIVMSVVGIVSWKKIEDRNDVDIHIVRMTSKIFWSSVLMFVAGTAGLYFVLKATSDPQPVLDAICFSLSLIGTWWLTRSHIEQWIVWMAADVVGIILYATQGFYGMSTLYLFYIVSSVVGIIHWKKKGTVVE